MTKWMRRSESLYLDNLARKARRRGDPVEAARWYRVAAIRHAKIDRFEAGLQRDIRFEQEQEDREHAQQQLARRSRPARRPFGGYGSQEEFDAARQKEQDKLDALIADLERKAYQR